MRFSIRKLVYLCANHAVYYSWLVGGQNANSCGVRSLQASRQSSRHLGMPPTKSWSSHDTNALLASRSINHGSHSFQYMTLQASLPRIRPLLYLSYQLEEENGQLESNTYWASPSASISEVQESSPRSLIGCWSYQQVTHTYCYRCIGSEIAPHKHFFHRNNFLRVIGTRSWLPRMLQAWLLASTRQRATTVSS